MPTDHSTLTDLHRLLGDLVSVNNRLTRVAARAAGGGTESPAVWRTLSVLISSGPMRLGELAELSRVSQPTASKLVESLDARGWILRTVDPTDARASLVDVTPVGDAALAQWRNELATAMMPLFADLPAEDIVTLQRAVDIVQQRVDTVEKKPVEPKREV
ncbi:MarR family winged helix-turn-helix transcriptional regulator [Glaciibacter superstes]|uniref:MarR family winged helix-turn-helix transcriptional regulator n=1 Tax=Glaciibacter superstes TaxID=501023 RepID=UPI0003B78BC3|nr:MarR family winged helix-turn-helix transcriptional regulator [Glaciibacter superstes]